jgi:hypothetical protein
MNQALYAHMNNKKKKKSVLTLTNATWLVKNDARGAKFFKLSPSFLPPHLQRFKCMSQLDMKVCVS